eukprot:1148771-Pelagomonas_calceolata.AAC.2
MKCHRYKALPTFGGLLGSNLGNDRISHKRENSCIIKFKMLLNKSPVLSTPAKASVRQPAARSNTLVVSTSKQQSELAGPAEQAPAGGVGRRCVIVVPWKRFACSHSKTYLPISSTPCIHLTFKRATVDVGACTVCLHTLMPRDGAAQRECGRDCQPIHLRGCAQAEQPGHSGETWSSQARLMCSSKWIHSELML